MQIWDTAGQEQHATIVPTFAKNVDACLLVFDLTNATSCQNIKKWQYELEKVKDVPIVIVGNKHDLAGLRKVSSEHLQELEE